MKKLVFVVSVICAVMLTACTSEKADVTDKSALSDALQSQISANEKDSQSKPDDNTQKWGISFVTNDVTDTGLLLVCTHADANADGEFHTGEWFRLEKFTDKGWKEPEQIDINIAWNDMAYIINKGGTTDFAVDWEGIYGKLEEGKYRISKEVTSFSKNGELEKCIYNCEFIIK